MKVFFSLACRHTSSFPATCGISQAIQRATRASPTGALQFCSFVSVTTPFLFHSLFPFFGPHSSLSPSLSHHADRVHVAVFFRRIRTLWMSSLCWRDVQVMEAAAASIIHLPLVNSTDLIKKTNPERSVPVSLRCCSFALDPSFVPEFCFNTAASPTLPQVFAQGVSPSGFVVKLL